MQQRISLITLGVADTSRAHDFYKAIGWTDGASPDGDVVFFQAGGMIVGLWGREDLEQDSGVTDGGGWGGVTLAHLVATPEEVDEILDAAQQAGASIPRAGSKRPWGGYSGIFVDPDGHPWEVAHNPAWTLEADGSVRL
jgi:uncharacterized protein